MSPKNSMVLLVSMFFLSLAACNRGAQPNDETATNSSNTDTSNQPLTTAANDYDSEYDHLPPETHEVIDYIDRWETISDPSHEYEPFAKLSSVVGHFMRLKDSLRSSGTPMSTDVFEKEEKLAFDAIMEYKKSMEGGNYGERHGVDLLSLPRDLGGNDSSYAFLPEARPSYFTDDNFFFLGGAPFVQRFTVYDTITHQQKIFKRPDGTPEIYFQSTDAENKYHLLKSVMHFIKPRLKIDFGGPVDIYDGPPHQVKGIGSVIHNFVDDIPAYFIMESGIVAGVLKYYQVPFTQQYACYSDYPYAIFSSTADINPNEIIGIYIPYDQQVPTTCSVSRPDRWQWSADLDNDAVPDIACVIGTYEGIEPGVLEMLWFVNLNGTWKILDYGAVPSCT
jgi:hypothetical protein